MKKKEYKLEHIIEAEKILNELNEYNEDGNNIPSDPPVRDLLLNLDLVQYRDAYDKDRRIRITPKGRMARNLGLENYIKKYECNKTWVKVMRGVGIIAAIASVIAAIYAILAYCQRPPIQTQGSQQHIPPLIQNTISKTPETAYPLDTSSGKEKDSTGIGK